MPATLAATALALQPGSSTAQDLRLGMGALLTPETALKSRSGFLPGFVPAVTKTTGMTASVAAFRALLQGAARADQGVYAVAMGSAGTIVFRDGDAQSRIDSVIVRVYENLMDSSGLTVARVEVVEGTPGASPSAPALSGTYLKIGDWRVNAGQSAGGGGLTVGNWTPASGPLTAALGGITPSRTAADVPGTYQGQYRHRIDTGLLECWDGAKWAPVVPNQQPTMVAPLLSIGGFDASKQVRRRVAYVEQNTAADAKVSIAVPGAVSIVKAHVQVMYRVAGQLNPGHATVLLSESSPSAIVVQFRDTSGVAWQSKPVAYQYDIEFQ